MRDRWSVSEPRISYLASRRSGFSFIEVIVALAVTAILVATVCVTLVTALSAERRLDDLRSAESHAGELVAYLFAGYDPTNAMAGWAGAWTAAGQEQSIGEGSNRITWSIWEVRAAGQADAGTRIALRGRAAD